MMAIDEWFDGELHELKPGRDWNHVETAVKEWAERTDKERSEADSLEPEDLAWVFIHPDEFQQRRFDVAEGWAAMAVMLQAHSRDLGGFPVCYQKGKRYFFQHKEEE